MAAALYLDVHVPLAVAYQLRRRGVDVVHSIEEQTNRLEDDKLLDLASQLGRVVVTQDVRFRAMAEGWQRQGRPFVGLVFGSQRGTNVGRLVKDLEILAKATDVAEWKGQVLHLPL
jgi:predicted nuclease of predicted toxin-antitoxin system